jgi:Dolichyl-phosphate-mannose-protein mannosyltransferase
MTTEISGPEADIGHQYERPPRSQNEQGPRPLPSPLVRWLGEARRLAASGLSWAADRAETRSGAAAVFLVALAAWWIRALAVPLAPGRDLGTYLGAYLQLFDQDPIDLGYVLGRTPLAPFVVGGLLDVAGGVLAEPAMSLLYASSIAAWFLAARSFGGRAALLTAVVLLLYPGYAILFHELSSDAVMAAAFAGWSLLTVRALLAPTVARIALAGAGVGVLVLVRPGNQVLLVLALFPLALRMPWRDRLASAVAFLVPALAIVGVLVLNNGLRWGDYTIARGGNAAVPFYRTYLIERIVSPDNGPASREVAEAVERELLPEEPYRSYGIDLDEFFSQGSPRMQVDLYALSNRLWGWDEDARKLRDVGVEAVEAHPLTYARGVATTMGQLLWRPVFRDLPARSGGGGGGSSGGGSGGGETIVVDGRVLPKPTEGEPIPAPREGGVTTPDGSIYTVWTSPSEHHMVFVRPGDEERWRALHRNMDELVGNLPDRDGSPELALRLNQSSRWYVPPVVWLLLGAVALVCRRPAGALALAVPSIAALLVDLVSALGLPAVPQYSVPTAPAFVLLAAGALFAARARAAATASLSSVGQDVRSPA